jgi:hypothetical protein
MVVAEEEWGCSCASIVGRRIPSVIVLVVHLLHGFFYNHIHRGEWLLCFGCHSNLLLEHPLAQRLCFLGFTMHHPHHCRRPFE